MPAVLLYLVISSAVAAALAACGAVVTALAQVVAEDIINGLSWEPPSDSVRLGIAQGTLGVTAALGGMVALAAPTDPLRLLLWSLALTASAAFPVLVLSVWWKRINAFGAMAGLIAGFAVAILAILGSEAHWLAVDSALAGSAGFADTINDAPGIQERISAARIVLEKADHAGKVLEVMETFGADGGRYAVHHPWAARLAREADIGAARQGGDMRLSVFHYPLHGWVDAVVMNVLMGRASVVQLRELSRVSYQPLAEVFRTVLPRETRHAELGLAGLVRIVDDAEGRARAKASAAYWYPRVAASFGHSGSARSIRESCAAITTRRCRWDTCAASAGCRTCSAARSLSAAGPRRDRRSTRGTGRRSTPT